MSQPVAAIDLGTNSARLLIAHRDPYQQLLLIRKITRLGGGFTRSHGLSEEAQRRSLDALRHFAQELERFGVAKVRGVTTSAVRDAANGASFCSRVLAETGIYLEVIDGAQEALLTLKGVLAKLDQRDGDLCLFDIGGGSTEYTLAREGGLVFSRSLPLGVVRLTEGKAGVAEMEDKILRELAKFREDLAAEGLVDRFCGRALIGTSGTATTLAAIHTKLRDFDYRKVNNFLLPLAEIERIFHLLLPMTPSRRLEVTGLEPGREDLIIAGTLLTILSMRTFGFESLKVSDAGLLEGVILGV